MDAPPMSLEMQGKLYRQKLTDQAKEGVLDIEGGLSKLPTLSLPSAERLPGLASASAAAAAKAVAASAS